MKEECDPQITQIGAESNDRTKAQRHEGEKNPQITQISADFIKRVSRS